MPTPDLRYRFHGRLAPAPERRELRAELSPSTEGDVATLRIYDPIDSWGGVWGISAKEFAEALAEVKDVPRLQLHINSPGGEVFEGIAILNQLRAYQGHTTVVIDGLAASAASFVAMGGDEVVMGRNAELMIHDAWGICVGNAEDMRDLGTRLDHLSDNIASIYAEKAGGTTADWRAAMLAETWYSADEAVEAGLADRVEEHVERVENRFDLSVFTYQGRSKAPAPVAVTAAPVPQEPEPGRSLAEVRHRLVAARHGLPL